MAVDLVTLWFGDWEQKMLGGKHIILWTILNMVDISMKILRSSCDCSCHGTSLAESHSSRSSSLYTFSKQIFALLQLAWYHQAELYTGSTLGCHIRDEVLQVICTFEVGYSSQHIDKTYTIQHPEHSLSLTTDRTYMIGPRKVMWDQQAKVLVCISTLQNLTVQLKDWCGGTLLFFIALHLLHSISEVRSSWSIWSIFHPIVSRPISWAELHEGLCQTPSQLLPLFPVAISSQLWHVPSRCISKH